MDAEKISSRQPLNEECMNAMNRLITEVQAGWESAKKAGWVSEENAYTVLELQ